MNGYNLVVFVPNNNGTLSQKSIPKNKTIIKKIIARQKLINDKPNKSEQNNIYDIQIGNSTIRNAPFLWYRENHLPCPFNKKISKISKQEMNSILVQYNIENNYNAIDNYIVVHENIINNANIYVSFHGYAYGKDHISGNNVNSINKKFNKNYIFQSIIKPISISEIGKTFTPERIPLFGPPIKKPIKKDLNEGIIFAPGDNNYKKNVYIKGNVHIHNLALSPSNHFKFNVDNSKDYIMLLVHGYSEKIKSANCLCLFVIINVNNFDKTKTEKIKKTINNILNT